MGTFFTYFFAAVAFMGTSVLGWLWFRGCEWDELFNCRDYKRLAIFIPITFAVVFLVVGIPRSLLPSPPLQVTPDGTPGPNEIHFPVKGKASSGKKRKKAKKEKIKAQSPDEKTSEIQNADVPREEEP